MKRFISIIAAAAVSMSAQASDLEFLLPSSKTQVVQEEAAPSQGVPSQVHLTKDNTLLLRGPISDTTASSLTQDLLTVPGKEAYLFIDSPGGSVVAAARIIAAMRSSDKKVTCIAETAISAAFMILQACDVRLITYSGITMQHNASLAVGRKEIPNFKTFVEFIYRMLDITDAIQAKRLGLSVEEFKNKTKDDWWLFSLDAVSNNVVDGMTTVKCSKDAIESTTSVSVQGFLGMVFKFDFSRCPLLSEPIPAKENNFYNPEEVARAYNVLMSREPIRDPLYMEAIK